MRGGRAAPCRCLVTTNKVLGRDAGRHTVRADWACFETPRSEGSRIFSIGRRFDRLAVVDGALRFAEKQVVFDAGLVPNSLGYPH